jgi:LCP family protein required for cell wall assembly
VETPRPRGLGAWWARHRALGHRTWGQRAVITAGCVVTVGLLASASSLSYVYDKFERLPRVELSGVLDDDTSAGEPENFLIVGIDNASNLDADDPVRRGRTTSSLSDTIMILRIDPESRQAALLSLPRDLWIPIPGTGSNQRINSTLSRGGPELLIRTIEADFGIPINHYVEVDFASFQGLVDAIDGVPIFNQYASRDRRTGLYVTELGCVTLDPVQALAYVRSRHYEQLIDGEWELDPASDLGRIDRQQDFIQRALSRAIDKGARNPATLDRLIDVGLEGITVDDSLTADDIFRLGNRFRNFEPQDLLTYSVPVQQGYAGEAAVVRLVADQAEPILEVFRGGQRPSAELADVPTVDRPDEDEDEPEDGAQPGEDEPSVSPETVTLEVLNGSGVTGQAAEATRLLAGVGFSVVGTSEMPSFDDDDTIVRYPPGQLAAAATVARWLRAGAELQESAEGSTIAVITGADWRGVLDEPRSAAGSGAATDDEATDEGTDATDATEGTDSTTASDDESGDTATTERTSTSRPSLTTAPPTTDASTGTDESTSTTRDLSEKPC